MREIDKDFTKTAEFTDVLTQVALKGNSISVKNDEVDFAIERIGNKNQRVYDDDDDDDDMIV